MSEQKTRAKYGYLSYNDMLTRIDEGVLDGYDVVYTTDTKECYVITPELQPMSIKSKVYVFDSLEEATKAVNSNADTYVGQVVSVYYKDAYRGYIVNSNKTRSTDLYSLTPLSEFTEEIDYNTLGNKPIINLTGTLDDPIILTELSNGVYLIKGQYQIAETDETIYLGASYNLFSIENNKTLSKIKKITSDTIIDYRVENNKITSSSLITDQYLESRGYATTTYVDNKFAALDIITKTEVESYIEEMIREILGVELETLVEQKIDEKIEPVQTEEITKLF